VDEVSDDPVQARTLAEDLVDDVDTQAAPAGLATTLAALDRPAERVDAPAASPPGPAPATLARPLADLLGAVQAADTLRADALADLTDAQRDGLAAPTALPGTQALDVRTTQNEGHVTATAEPAEDGSADPATLEQVDQAKLRTAALTLLATAHERLDTLSELDLDAERGTCPGVGGSVVFEGPNCDVVVGSPADNTYGPAAEPTLLVDLGGSDTYANSAAGAAGTVQLLVDAQGDDTYTANANDEGSLLAQGAGSLGVGVLVDGAGDDTYTASLANDASEPGPVAQSALVRAQGTAALGAGVLADLGGADEFDAKARSSGGSTAVQAQGVGAVGGVGLLVNGPAQLADGDTYQADATSTLHQTSGGQVQQYEKGTATTIAQGAGAVGAGALVDLGGADTYEATGNGAAATTLGQGASETGAGALVDVAGDDEMRTAALGDTVLRLVTNDPSFCWRVTVTVSADDVDAVGQGATLLGVGLLADGAGNDERTVTADGHAGAIAKAFSDLSCTRSIPNTATATANGGSATATGQAADSGAGVLADLGTGADVNRVRSHTSARAVAIADSPGYDEEDASATSGSASTVGQGVAGLGAATLVDTAGADTYDSRVATSATEITSSGTQAGTTGTLSQTLHANAGTGIAAFADLGGQDAYTTSPSGASPASNDDCWSLGPQSYGIDTSPTTLPSCL